MIEKRFKADNYYFEIWDNDEFLLSFDKTVDLLNQLNDENEQLKKVLGAILLEVKQDITNTNQTGEIKVFINPNSFNLISEVLRKYGALKGWYDD